MANLVHERVWTDRRSTARQNLVLDEAGTEAPVVFEEDPGTSGRLRPLACPTFRELLASARPGGTVRISETLRLVRGTVRVLDVLDVLRREYENRGSALTPERDRSRRGPLYRCSPRPVQ